MAAYMSSHSEQQPRPLAKAVIPQLPPHGAQGCCYSIASSFGNHELEKSPPSTILKALRDKHQGTLASELKSEVPSHPYEPQVPVLYPAGSWPLKASACPSLLSWASLNFED